MVRQSTKGTWGKDDTEKQSHTHQGEYKLRETKETVRQKTSRSTDTGALSTSKGDNTNTQLVDEYHVQVVGVRGNNPELRQF